MNEKGILALDGDDTIWDFEFSWKLYYQETYGEPCSMNWGDQSVLKRAHEFIRSRHHDLMPAMEGAVEAIHTLATRRTLVIVTMRDALLAAPTIRLVERHFPKAFKDVHFMSYEMKEVHASKGEFCRNNGIKELADDGVGHVISARDAGIRSFLYHRESNKDANVPGVTRIHSLTELLDHIK